MKLSTCARLGRFTTHTQPKFALSSITPRFFSVVPFKLADIGEGIAEVELLKWFVKEGDNVKSFDRICEVQSDKATVEITSRFSGKITQLNHSEGAIVKVGDALIHIDTEDSNQPVNIQPSSSSASSTNVTSLPPSSPQSSSQTGSTLSTPSSSSSSSSSNSIVPFKLADIGEGIAEVELMKWFVKEGDQVKSFDRICEVQSDKATVEITSRFSGRIHSLNHSEGSIVKVGDALVMIETNSPSSSSPTSSSPSISPTTPSSPSPSSSPSSTANVNHVDRRTILTTPAVRKIAKEKSIDLTLVRGTGPKGRILKEDLLSLLSGKTTLLSPSLLHSHHNVPSPSHPSHPSPSSTTPSSSTPPSTPTPTPPSSTTPPSTTPPSSTRVVPIRGVQRLMVKSMNAAALVKHLTLGEEIEMNGLIALRSQMNQMLNQGKKNHPVTKLSYLPFLLKATSLALLEYPELNATVNTDCTEITYHGSHNLGIAVDTPKGLLVPVIKGVEKMSILEIAAEMQTLTSAAVSGRITESQLQGGTFSLSNIGSIGGTFTVPVLVVPQVTIGALGRIQHLPRYYSASSPNIPATLEEIQTNKAVVLPASVMQISWSADHRVVDGATVARFSNAWKRYVENPQLMLANLR